jgi:hypothetical protein
MGVGMSQMEQRTSVSTTAVPRERAPYLPRAVSELGFWSAILTGILSAAWAVFFGLQNAVSPIPQLGGAAAYVREFERIHMLNLYPSILLPVPFIILMASIYIYASEDKKIWGVIAVAMSVLYGTMASINYYIQLVSVQQSLLAGESAGLDMFVQSNPRAIFAALANSYVYNSLAMCFAAPIFQGGGLERGLRWIFSSMGAVALIQVAYALLELPLLVAAPAGIAWAIGVPVACGLLAILFRRAEALRA